MYCQNVGEVYVEGYQLLSKCLTKYHGIPRVVKKNNVSEDEDCYYRNLKYKFAAFVVGLLSSCDFIYVLAYLWFNNYLNMPPP